MKMYENDLNLYFYIQKTRLSKNLISVDLNPVEFISIFYAGFENKFEWEMLQINFSDSTVSFQILNVHFVFNVVRIIVSAV